MSHDDMAKVFAEWNKGELDSFLIEITKDILGTPRRLNLTYSLHSCHASVPLYLYLSLHILSPLSLYFGRTLLYLSLSGPLKNVFNLIFCPSCCLAIMPSLVWPLKKVSSISLSVLLDVSLSCLLYVCL